MALSYPRFCSTCLTQSVHQATIYYIANISDGSKMHQVTIPELKVGKCACGNILFDLETDNQIDNQFRQELLLSSVQSMADSYDTQAGIGSIILDAVTELGIKLGYWVKVEGDIVIIKNEINSGEFGHMITCHVAMVDDHTVALETPMGVVTIDLAKPNSFTKLEEVLREQLLG